MSHHIYKTEAIVLGGFNIGESNRFIYMFTKDLGLVGVSAQGIRELKSKLKYSLQDFSYTSIDLVKGKDVWRVINADQIYSFGDVVKDRAKKKVFLNVIILIKRLLAGQLSNEEMWQDVYSGFCFLKNTNLTKKELQFFEAILVLKILNHLGYWGEDKELDFFVENKIWDIETLNKMDKFYKNTLKKINKSLMHSHL